METLQFERDDITGLWKWPVMLNGDWSQWTDEPCTVIWGQFDQFEHADLYLIAQRASEVLNSSLWPSQTSFRVGVGGILIIAPSYTSSQALLLADSVNRELKSYLSQCSPYSKASVTWATIDIATPHWNLPRVLNALLASTEQAIRELRWGSINEVIEPNRSVHHDDFFVSYGRDSLTGLNLWGQTLALCSRYRDEPIALLMGDLDHLRQINSKHGLPGGDLSLQMLAHVLRRFESNDVVLFRAWSDKFFLWARGYSIKRSEKLIGKINEALSLLQVPMPYTDGIESISMTWSVVAASPRDLALSEFLLEADKRLDKLKSEQQDNIGTPQM